MGNVHASPRRPNDINGSRSLASSDTRILLASLIFILNCVHGSRERLAMMSKTATGVRACILLLDDMVNLYDAKESSDGAQAFDVGYDILTRFIQEGLVSELYVKFSIQDEIVTPHQTTLLKIVDSYLQANQRGTALTALEMTQSHAQLSPLLAQSFFALSTYAQHAIRRALGPDIATVKSNTANLRSSGMAGAAPLPPAELDVMLPKVCEALVLVTQCIVTITLDAEDQQGRTPRPSTPNLDYNQKVFFNEARGSDHGLPESLIELLRLLDRFLPRINFGKPVTSAAQQLAAPESAGFSYLKRDLVRLLGILCHNVKSVQDRVRICGGIEVVMNLCVVDERNPYLREHAIFTLHSLLKGNAENQAIVDAVKPTSEWDENGVLRDTPGSVLK